VSGPDADSGVQHIVQDPSLCNRDPEGHSTESATSSADCPTTWAQTAKAPSAELNKSPGSLAVRHKLVADKVSEIINKETTDLLLEHFSATSAAHDLRLAKVSRKNENCIQNIRFAHKWEIERLLEEVRVQQDADNHQYEADLGEGRAAIEKWKLQTEAAKEELRRTQEGTFDKTWGAGKGE